MTSNTETSNRRSQPQQNALDKINWNHSYSEKMKIRYFSFFNSWFVLSKSFQIELGKMYHRVCVGRDNNEAHLIPVLWKTVELWIWSWMRALRTDRIVLWLIETWGSNLYDPMSWWISKGEKRPHEHREFGVATRSISRNFIAIAHAFVAPKWFCSWHDNNILEPNSTLFSLWSFKLSFAIRKILKDCSNYEYECSNPQSAIRLWEPSDDSKSSSFRLGAKPST